MNYNVDQPPLIRNRIASLTLCIQYAVAAPVYPDPIMTTSVSDGNSSFDGKALNSGSAASIQYDFDGFLTGRTILNKAKNAGQIEIKAARAWCSSDKMRLKQDYIRFRT